MINSYHTGFMSDKPNWGKALRHFRLELMVFLTDIAFLAALWMLTTYVLQNPGRGVLLFLTVPWWAMLVAVAVVAGIWQSFGLSPGMKLLGRRLVDSSDTHGAASLGRRFLRSLLLIPSPLLVLPTLVLARYIPLHDCILGFETVSAAKVVDPKRAWYLRSWPIAVGLLAIMAFIVSAMFTQVDLAKLFKNFDSTAGIRNQLTHPNWSILIEGGQLLLVTLFMALMATLFGIIVAIPLSFVAARNLTQGAIGRIVYTLVRGLLSILRSIQPFIWVIVLIVWVKPGNAPMAGVIALFIHSVADLTKLYAERLESIDPGPVEAIQATGANRIQVIIYGIIPQIINPYMSFTIYRWDINVRMSTIVGMVGGGGIGMRLLLEMRVNNYSNAVVLMMLIMLAVWSMDTMSARLRARIESGSSQPSLPTYAIKLKTRLLGDPKGALR
ncbi:phosphonate ABC transporter, permease protein PhnE [Candidatus Bipolaricaulota bacterium]|nr:phosphonate ABC transporter, permease protein PhnE [Candidatus Bipolaricaulota bacterium]